MTRPLTSSRAIVVRMVGAALAIVVMAIILIAMASCEGPPSCPPPIGCAK